MFYNILFYIILNYRKKVFTMPEMFLLLGGGLLIIIFAVVISVVSSVVSAVAADSSDLE